MAKGRSGLGKGLRTKSPTMGAASTKGTRNLGAKSAGRFGRRGFGNRGIGRKGVSISPNAYPAAIRQPNQPTQVTKLGVRRGRISRKSVTTQKLERSGGIGQVAASISGGTAPKTVPMSITGPKAPSGLVRR